MFMVSLEGALDISIGRGSTYTEQPCWRAGKGGGVREGDIQGQNQKHPTELTFNGNVAK